MPVRIQTFCFVALWLSLGAPAVCQPPEAEATDEPTAAEAQEEPTAQETAKLPSVDDADADLDLDDFFGASESTGDLPDADSTDSAATQGPTETAKRPPSEDAPADLDLDGFFGGGDAEESDDEADESDQLKRTSDSALVPSDLLTPGDLAVEPSIESGEEAPPTDLVDDYQSARRLALLHQRPLLVIFGAEWCGWCRKLEEDLDSQEGDPIRRQWVVAKVDVDDQPRLAQEMDVGSLPALRILNASGDVVASRTGYVELTELQSWLEENLQQADPSIQRVLFASGVPSPSDIEELAAMLQQRSPSVRASASRRLREHRSVTAGTVVDQLRNGPLSSQLTALEILEAWDAPVVDLDPWLPETINDDRLQPLMQWVRSIPADQASDQETAPAEKIDDQSAARIVRELIEAPSVRHRELTEQAVAGGMPVADQVEQVLNTLDSLSDDQRQRLREVRYGILAGPATRIESTGLLESIARLDGPTRRAAAKRLILSLTSQDQPLIDDLSRDSDPLVRELAVTAQSRVGALTQGDRLQRLLADENPSVRTAVLRQIAENPTDEVTARLVDYLDTESDEDLLVYATKTLGQLAENEIASKALAAHLDDSRWRVRAAALDAIQQFLEESSSTSWFSDAPATVPPSITAGVLAALEDEDRFVASKAATVLPYILSRDTAEAIADYMLEDETHFATVYESVEEYRRDGQLQPLSDLAAGWLDGDDSQRTADATRLLTRVAPTKLRYKLADLLESPQREIRIAALRASLPCLEEFREEQLSEERSLWQRFAAREATKQLAAIPLLRPIPDAFLRSTDESEPPSATEEPSDLAAQGSEGSQTSSAADPSEPTSIDLVDDFFGAAPATTPDDDAATSDTAAVVTDEAIVDAEAALAERVANDETDEGLNDASDNETEVREGGGLLGWVGSIFGGSAEQPAEPDRETNVTWAGVAENKLDRDRLGSGSYWMHRWQNERDTIKRPTWMRRCEPLVQDLISSDDPVEQMWAQAVWLAYGNTEQHAALQQQFDAGALPDDAPRMIDLVSWLPASDRLDWLKQIEVDWNELSKESTEQLRATTQLDLEGAPAWFVEQITEEEVERSESIAAISHLMLEAMLGRDAAQELPIRMADEVKLDANQSLSVPKTPMKFAGQLPAIRWSLEQYKQANSDAQKAVLLSILSTTSRKHAIAEALGILDESEEESRLTEVAAALALSDLRALSARRAVVLLEHPLKNVAEEALLRLVSIDRIPDSAANGLPLAAIYYEQPRTFALQELDRPLPADGLRRFDSGEPTTISALADLLRLAAGEDRDPLEIIERLRGREQVRSLVAVALARAGRTDEAAMRVYVACVENAESEETTAVYRALRTVKDDRISNLRRQLLKAKDGFFP